MQACRTIRESTCRAILSVVLLGFISAGVPLAEVHAHDDAYFGHSHDHHDVDVDDHDLDELADGAQASAGGTLHVHDVNAPALTLIFQFDVNDVSVWTETPVPIPPLFRPPDNVTGTLYRPPIA